MSKDEQVVERHIFMPDFTPEGTLVTLKNRKRFFSEGKKINEELPVLYTDVLQKIHTTLIKLVRES